MGYVKANTATLAMAISKAQTVANLISDIEDCIDDYKTDSVNESNTWASNEAIISKWISYVKSKHHGDTDYGKYNYQYDGEGNRIPGSGSWSWYNDSVRTEAISLIKSKKAGYDNTGKCLAVSSIAKTNIDNIVQALTDIQTAITTFEESPVDLKDALDKLNVTLPDGFSVEDITINLDGEEVTIQTLVYTIDGKQYTVSEMVNAFYTYVGITVASNVSLAFANPNLSPADMDALLSANGANTKHMVNSYLSKGFMSVVSADNISAMYKDATGTEFDKDTVHNKYMESFVNFDIDKLNEAFEGLTNAAAIGSMSLSGLFSSAYEDAPSGQEVQSNIAANFSTEDGEAEIDREKLKKTDEKKGKKDDDLEGAEAEILGDLLNPIGKDGTGLSGDTGFFEDTGGTDNGDSANGLESVLEPTDEKPGFDEDLSKYLEEVIDPVTDEIKPAPEPEPLTNEDIDDMAQDAFYDQFTPEELADYRNEQIEELNNLDKEELIDYLEESGYTAEDASVIADNNELSLAAFLTVKQSNDLLNMSKDIAANANMDMTMFDTRFDDAPSLESLMNGDANAFLSNPNLDQNVMTAKTAMNNAKVNYDDALTRANDSITEANENKENLESIKKDIVKKYGEDTKKWSAKDVEKYNNAVDKYNKSVTKANDDVSSAQKAKETYESSKETYENSKDEFYDKIKEDVVSNRELSPSDDFPTEIPDNTPEEGNNLGTGNNQGTGEFGNDNGEYVGVSDDGSGLGVRDPGENVDPTGGQDTNTVELSSVDQSDVTLDQPLNDSIPTDLNNMDNNEEDGNGEGVVSKGSALGFFDD